MNKQRKRGEQKQRILGFRLKFLLFCNRQGILRKKRKENESEKKGNKRKKETWKEKSLGTKIVIENRVFFLTGLSG